MRITEEGALIGSERASARWANILPIVFIMYTIAYFDRANIGIALPYITNDLKLSASHAGFIGGVFAWGYTATQIIAGVLIGKFGSRNVVGMALATWGFAAVATGFVDSFEQLVAVRILLGLFEGPVFAATAMLLTEWFTKPERGRAFGIWNLSSPIGAFLAGPISGLVLSHYDWRVMMVVEGLPAWIWAVLWWWRIPANLDNAKWLSDEERDAVKHQLAQDQQALNTQNLTGSEKESSWLSTLREPVVWVTLIGFTLVNFLINGYTLWLPSAIKSMSDMSPFMVGLISGMPFLLGAAGVYFNAQHSDRHGQERRWHSSVPTIITGLIVLSAMLVPAEFIALKIGLIVAAGLPMKMFLPLIFTTLTENLPRPKAVTAVVIVNTAASFIAGFGGPYLIGYLKHITGNFDFAFAVLGAAAVMAGIVFAFISPASKQK